MLFRVFSSDYSYLLYISLMSKALIFRTVVEMISALEMADSDCALILVVSNKVMGYNTT